MSTPTPSKHKTPNDPLSKGKRLRRGRSSRACLSCRKRKVRCDITRKKHPFEKCTNCFEFGVDCQVIDKVTASVVSSLKRPIVNYPTNPVNHQSVNPLQVQRSQQQRWGQLTPDPVLAANTGRKIFRNEIQLDPKKILSNGITRRYLTQSFKNTTPSYYLKFAIEEFMLSEDGFNESVILNNDVLVRSMHLTNKEICSLPKLEICNEYISGFIKFNRTHRIVNEVSFLRDYSDFKNPPSFLLFRCALYIGSNMCRTKNGNHDPNSSPEMLFQCARTLYIMGTEFRPIPLVQSLILLSLCPESDTTFLVDRLGFLDTSMSTAIQFSMHLDQSQNASLTEEEKITYKVLFWYLFTCDKFLSLTTNRSYKIDIENCTVSKLSKDEILLLLFNGEESPEANLYVVCFLALDSFCDLMIQVTKSQTLAYELGFQGSLVNHVFIDILSSIDNWYNSLPKLLRNESISGKIYHISKLYRNILKFSVLDSAILFRTQLVRKCTRFESGSLRKVILGMDLSSYQFQCCRIFHDTVQSVPELIKLEDIVKFFPGSIKVLLHIVISSSFGLFHVDSELRKCTRDGFALISELYPTIVERCFHNSGGPLIKTGEFFFNKIYPDEGRLIRFLRDAFESDIIEFVLNLDFDVMGDTIPFEPDFKELVRGCISNIGPPIFNLNNSNMEPSTSYDELQKMFTDIYNQDKNLVKEYVMQFGATTPVDKFTSQFERFLPHVELSGPANRENRDALTAFNCLAPTNFGSSNSRNTVSFPPIISERIDLNSSGITCLAPVSYPLRSTLPANYIHTSNEHYYKVPNQQKNTRKDRTQQMYSLNKQSDNDQISLEQSHLRFYSSAQEYRNGLKVENNPNSGNEEQMFDGSGNCPSSFEQNPTISGQFFPQP